MEKNFKYELINNILSYIEYQILDITRENNKKLPTFNKILNIINDNNDNHDYEFTLKDIDYNLFKKLIIEIKSIL